MRPITCLDVAYQDDGAPARVGGHAVDPRGRVHFQYDAAWIARGLELSPYQLPVILGSVVIAEPVGKALHGLHGVFADSLPDSWGTRVVDGTVDASGTASTDSAALDALERAAGSAGGAQPKVMVALSSDAARLVAGTDAPDGYVPYLVKFTPTRDGLGLRTDGGVLEEAYARMARDAGIVVAPSRLLTTSDGRLHFAVERFDRTRTGGRRHVHTFSGLLGRAAADEGDYDELLRWTRALTGDDRAVEAVVRRLWFNLRVRNDDDHLKNVAFLLDPADGWTLAPAYDLTYAPSRGGVRGMSVAGHEADVTWPVVATLAARHGVRLARVADLRDQVDAAVGRWAAHAEASHVPAPSVAELNAAFARRNARLAP